MFGWLVLCSSPRGYRVIKSCLYIWHVRLWWQYPHCARGHKKCGFPSWGYPFCQIMCTGISRRNYVTNILFLRGNLLHYLLTQRSIASLLQTVKQLLRSPPSLICSGLIFKVFLCCTANNETVCGRQSCQKPTSTGRQPFPLTFTPEKVSISKSISLGCERKPEYLEGLCVGTGRPCNLHSPPGDSNCKHILFLLNRIDIHPPPPPSLSASEGMLLCKCDQCVLWLWVFNLTRSRAQHYHSYTASNCPGHQWIWPEGHRQLSWTHSDVWRCNSSKLIQLDKHDASDVEDYGKHT